MAQQFTKALAELNKASRCWQLLASLSVACQGLAGPRRAWSAPPRLRWARQVAGSTRQGLAEGRQGAAAHGSAGQGLARPGRA
eukprot:2155931-Pyramimonas_sp.AAC.1